MSNITDFGGLNYHKRTRLSRQKMNPHSVNFRTITGSYLLKFLGICENAGIDSLLSMKKGGRFLDFPAGESMLYFFVAFRSLERFFG
jgi:hypothetical protein